MKLKNFLSPSFHGIFIHLWIHKVILLGTKLRTLLAKSTNKVTNFHHYYLEKSRHIKSLSLEGDGVTTIWTIFKVFYDHMGMYKDGHPLGWDDLDHLSRTQESRLVYNNASLL